MLDLGAGNGLLGEVLAELDICPVDAADISPEMLGSRWPRMSIAMRSRPTGPSVSPTPANSYAGIVPSGAFTRRHASPKVIDALLRVARPGAVLALSKSAEHCETQGFATKFDALGDRIAGLSLIELPIYGPKATGPHKDDTALVLVPRKA